MENVNVGRDLTVRVSYLNFMRTEVHLFVVDSIKLQVAVQFTNVDSGYAGTFEPEKAVEIIQNTLADPSFEGFYKELIEGNLEHYCNMVGEQKPDIDTEYWGPSDMYAWKGWEK